MIFKKPIFVFDEVSIYGDITAVGKTSFTVSLTAYVRRATDYNADPIFVGSADIVYALIKKPGEKTNEIIHI
jgi:acyl-CoA hydrolase